MLGFGRSCPERGFASLSIGPHANVGSTVSATRDATSEVSGHGRRPAARQGLHVGIPGLQDAHRARSARKARPRWPPARARRKDPLQPPHRHRGLPPRRRTRARRGVLAVEPCARRDAGRVCSVRLILSQMRLLTLSRAEWPCKTVRSSLRNC